MIHSNNYNYPSLPRLGAYLMVCTFLLSIAAPSFAADDWKTKVRPLLEKAHAQMELALSQTEEALGPHRKGSAWVTGLTCNAWLTF